MKTFLTIFVLLFVVSTSSLVWSADFQKGLSAYKSGDYETALYELNILAEMGDMTSQYNLGVMYFLGQGTNQNYDEAVKWY